MKSSTSSVKRPDIRVFDNMNGVSQPQTPVMTTGVGKPGQKPWKEVGYRGFSNFLASENDFLVFRRFSTLAARVLLALQDELSELEEQLLQLEIELSSPNAQDIHNGSFRQERSQARLTLIQTIDKKLRWYNELVIQHTNLRSRPRAADKDIESVSNWFHNHPKAILDEETKYIQRRQDLFALVPTAKVPLRKLLERSSHFRLFWLWRKPSDHDDANVHYMSDYRINLFVAFIITIVGLAMLVAPLWILACVEHGAYRLGIITVFLVIFLCFVSFTTVARPFETLGATAAYAAVLVVFLQLTPQLLV